MSLPQSASERLARRYLLVAGEQKALKHVLLEYLGVLGWARAVPVIVSEKPIIIAVARSAVSDVRAALALAGITVMRVSGTLAGLKRSV